MWPYSTMTELSSPEFLEPPRSQSTPLINDIPVPNFDMDDLSSDIKQNSKQEGPIPISSNTYVIPSVTPEVAASIIKGNYRMFFDQILVIDCRYKYEFAGGHIRHAENVVTYERLQELYNKYKQINVCVLFHCEFSTKRGPTWASIFRDIDRNHNKMNYPRLTYEHVYLIEGGYSAFFKKFECLCRGGYTPMEVDGTLDLSNLKKAKRLYKLEIQKHYGPRTPPVHRRVQDVKMCHNIFRSVSFTQPYN